MRWVVDNYGSRRGLLRHVINRTAGLFRPWKHGSGELGEVSRLVFVCKGNICRSPMAEVAARSMGFSCSSFGIDTELGKPPDPEMVAAASSVGYDLSTHRASPLSQYDGGTGDLMLLFDPDHFTAVEGFREVVRGVGLLGAWARPPRPYIHDPFGGTEGYFGTVALVIDDAVRRLVDELRDRHV